VGFFESARIRVTRDCSHVDHIDFSPLLRGSQRSEEEEEEAEGEAEEPEAIHFCQTVEVFLARPSSCSALGLAWEFIEVRLSGVSGFIESVHCEAHHCKCAIILCSLLFSVPINCF